MFIGFKMRTVLPGKSFFYLEKRNPLQEIINLIDKKYVDDVELNHLTDTAIMAILSKLDPHSYYIPPQELQSINEEINGSFYGIGIEFVRFEDTIHVTNVLENGPSFKAGLQIGDRLISANDSSLVGANLSTDQIKNLLRGPFDSELKLNLLRKGEVKTVSIHRGIIPISSIDAAYMIDSTTGFIRINKFTGQTYREFMEQLMALKEKNMQQLILDLRDNGGGVLEEAVEIADEFLEGEKLITYTEGENAPKKEYRCRRKGQFETGKLIVLANEGTASASEILIGALQDWGRAEIVGRRTFGKGLVQEQFTLSNKAAIRLTVARYFTPVGRSIQRPYQPGEKSYFDEINNRYIHGELTNADSIRNDTSNVFITHTGKRIYGGGGITPEHFVAADTSRMGSTTIRLYRTGVLNNFGYKYYISHDSLYQRYKDPADFVKHYQVGAKEWQYLETQALKDSVEIGDMPDSERRFMETLMKSALASQIFRNNGYFQVINQTDDTVQKALEIIHLPQK